MTLAEKDKAYIWHPFTQMKLAKEPIVIEKAQGTYLYTADGHKIIDAVSSWWVNLHGHAHPYITQKIAEQAQQLEHVIFAGFTHKPAIHLAENILSILPKNFSKVFFSDNGSTAVEVAIKMALQFWHNQGKNDKITIVAFDNAYHGDTFGAMAVGGRSAFSRPFENLLFEVKHLSTPTDENFEVLIHSFDAVFREKNTAAFIYEPLVQGASGMLMYEAIYLEKILALAKKHGVLCIADEVMTGFGRTGKLFASDYISIKPDIICLSKGITGGFMPLGLTVCSEAIYQAFYADDKLKALYHGHSYTANPLACAAANASFELLMAAKTQEQIKLISTKNEVFVNKIRQSPRINAARNLGTILAIELKTPDNTSYFSAIRDKIYDFCLDKGVLLRPLGNILYCMPPYCISSEDLDYVYTVMEAATKIE